MPDRDRPLPLPKKPPHPADLLDALHDKVHEENPPPKAPRFRRMKRKPPAGARCCAYPGVSYGKPSPQVVRCSNEATVEAHVRGQFGEAWLCEDCAAKIEQRDLIAAAPRLYEMLRLFVRASTCDCEPGTSACLHCLGEDALAEARGED